MSYDLYRGFLGGLRHFSFCTSDHFYSLPLSEAVVRGSMGSEGEDCFRLVNVLTARTEKSRSVWQLVLWIQ